MAVPKKKQSKTRTAKRRANWKSGGDVVQLVSAMQAAQDARTACAATAGTTPAARPSRSSSRVPPAVAQLDALDRALGVRFHDAALREAALTHRSFAFEQGLDGHERAPGVPRATPCSGWS